MKKFLFLCFVLNAYFTIILTFELVLYFSDPTLYVFGMEAGGFSYRSEYHYVGSLLFIACFHGLGVASRYVSFLDARIGIVTAVLAIASAVANYIEMFAPAFR